MSINNWILLAVLAIALLLEPSLAQMSSGSKVSEVETLYYLDQISTLSDLYCSGARCGSESDKSFKKALEDFKQSKQSLKENIIWASENFFSDLAVHSSKQLQEVCMISIYLGSVLAAAESMKIERPNLPAPKDSTEIQQILYYLALAEDSLEHNGLTLSGEPQSKVLRTLIDILNECGKLLASQESKAGVSTNLKSKLLQKLAELVSQFSLLSQAAKTLRRNDKNKIDARLTEESKKYQNAQVAHQINFSVYQMCIYGKISDILVGTAYFIGDLCNADPQPQQSIKFKPVVSALDTEFQVNSGRVSATSNSSNSTEPSITDVLKGVISLIPAVTNQQTTTPQIPCPAACSNCSGQTCRTCVNSYVLSVSGSCLPCPSNCILCNSSSECVFCTLSYYISAAACLPCDASCLACINTATNCILCQPGLSALNGKCVSCPANCQLCLNSTCVVCMTGFINAFDASSNTTSCLACIAPCALCLIADVTACTACFDGQYLSSFKCVNCPANCLTCSSIACLSCLTGYSLLNGACKANCVAPCITCEAADASSCTSCDVYSVKSGKTCQADLACNTASNCVGCTYGYTFLSNKCVKCSVTDPNCLSCSSTDTNTCTYCSNGYYLRQKACLACATGCTSCLSAASCVQCNQGYTLPSNIPYTSCVKCAAGCATCSSAAASCLSCTTGYVLRQSQCVDEQTIIQYSLVLVLSLQGFLSKFVFYKKQLSALLGAQFDISGLANGSTVVTGAVISTTPGATAASLNAKLVSGAPLGETTIVSSSLTTPTITGSSSPANGNVQVIVPVVLGTLGLISLIAFVVYFKNKKQQDSEFREVAYTQNEVTKNMDDDL